jgi:probable rRNA maturation factor
MTVRITNRQRQIRIDRGAVKRLVDLILCDHDESPCDVSIVFARDALLAELNASFRDLDRPTDVLAFPMEPDRAETDEPDVAGPERVLGDVIISVDRAAEQSRRYGKTPEQELLKLVAHGVLHLLGHDHESPGERRQMRNLENRYLRLLTREAR